MQILVTQSSHSWQSNKASVSARREGSGQRARNPKSYFWCLKYYLKSKHSTCFPLSWTFALINTNGVITKLVGPTEHPLGDPIGSYTPLLGEQALLVLHAQNKMPAMNIWYPYTPKPHTSSGCLGNTVHVSHIRRQFIPSQESANIFKDNANVWLLQFDLNYLQKPELNGPNLYVSYKKWQDFCYMLTTMLEVSSMNC